MTMASVAPPCGEKYTARVMGGGWGVGGGMAGVAQLNRKKRKRMGSRFIGAIISE